AGTEPREHFRILEFVAEREVVGARGDQLVVFVTVAARHRYGLHADESSHSLANGAHERLALLQAVGGFAILEILTVIAGVEVREDAVGFLPRGECYLDDI